MAAAAVQAPTPAAQPEAEATTVADGPSLEELKQCLADEKAPIAKRMRSVFFLKQMGGLPAIQALATGLTAQSVLLSHEAAYVLGQMQDPRAVPFLSETLRNTKLNPITRHEAAEALGALGLSANSAILTEFCDDAAIEVRETCRIAMARLAWLNDPKRQQDEADAKASGKAYHSVDPAPPAKETNIEVLQKQLNDASKTLFERYKAMFRLRNIGSEAAVLALASGFNGPDSVANGGSAVFRHEICYVFGQLRHAASIPSLKERLEDAKEHAMVRHEAAEALGAIAGVVSAADAKKCEPLLSKFAGDGDKIVAESCHVALDISDYWSSDQFDAVAPTTAPTTAAAAPAAAATAATAAAEKSAPAPAAAAKPV